MGLSRTGGVVGRAGDFHRRHAGAGGGGIRTQVSRQSWGGDMNECSAEGGLRAYLDRELPPEEMTQIAVHLGGCAACHTRYNELAGRAARVAALMETLQAGPIGQQFAPTGRRWRTGAAVLALAAAAGLAFV